MKIKFADATIKQIAKAKANFPHLISRIHEGKTYDEILMTLKKEEAARPVPYRNYDRWGRLTAVGKEVRKYQLKLQKLAENTTIEEFFQKEVEKNRKTVLAVINKVKKNYSGTYGPKK